MIISPKIRKCVCFVGCQMDGGYHLQGTAFLVAKSTATDWWRPVYLVTAGHVIDGIRDLGCQEVLLRVNFKDGVARWLTSKLDDWYFHPTGHRSIDVAVLPLFRTSLGDDIDHDTYPLQSSVTPEVISQYNVGPGEEIFMTGLFTRHHGQERNIPIVRSGNLAAMREEEVSTMLGPMDAYLVEARSIGGLSGSPVFLYLGAMRVVMTEARQVAVTHSTDALGVFYLLGLMHGHWEQDASNPDIAVPDVRQVNMGIGIVVPTEKITDVINQPKLQELEAQITREHNDENLPRMDAATSELSFTRPDFERALRKASKRIQPSQSDEGK